MPTDMLALSRMCEENARAAAARQREVTRVGPFEALLDRHDPVVWLNYAVPIAPLADPLSLADALAELRRLFSARGRRLRFEYHAAPWPDLTALLIKAGLELQAEHPTMACGPAELRPFMAPSVNVQIFDASTTEADLLAFRMIQAEGFNMQRDKPDAAELDRLRERLAGGDELLGLARVDGQPAAAAALYPIDSVAELAGVATRPALRRRGAAASLSAVLSAHFFAGGGKLAWLSAGDAIAYAVYGKVGFYDIDLRLNYITPEN